MRNAGLSALKYKQEVALMKQQSTDITTFEEDLQNFKDGFARNYDLASRKFNTAIDEIDKTLYKTWGLKLSDNLTKLNNQKVVDKIIEDLKKFHV